MGHIMMPDPHPGRCDIYRTKAHSDGHIETLRCLKGMGHERICEFPAPTHVVTSGGLTYKTSAPQRWIRPDGRPA